MKFIYRAYFLILVFLISGSMPAQADSSRIWQKLGGPIGGLGYNVKIDPQDPKTIYVTDAFTGVQKSTNGGKSWSTINNGIMTRVGPSNDEIPVFSLSIDPSNSNIIWVGTQGEGAIYKSTDGGKSFSQKNNGIEEDAALTIRNFAIYPDDNQRVIMTGELDVGEAGDEFSKVKGVMYRTDNGGESWTKLWEGDSLARWVCINPLNTDSIVVATGIFDREAFNTNGLGAIKTTDEGETWFDANNGISGSLFMGGMAMHNDLPATILVATGNNNDFNKGINGAVFLSTDAAESWEQVYPQSNFNFDYKVYTSTAFAPSNPKIMYIGSSEAIFRSSDSGKTWTKYSGLRGTPWGPNGIRAGVPIEIQVDPKNPNIVYVNNYGGGVFRSINGGKTWKNFSKGYTGANLYSVAVSDKKANRILVNGRSGPFKSNNAGLKWKGLAVNPVNYAEGLASAIDPRSPKIMYISDEHNAQIFKSINAGKSWSKVFEHPDADASDANNRHGAKEILISKSNPEIIYAGFSNDGLFADPHSEDFSDSFGVYKSVDAGRNWFPANTGLELTTQNITAMVVNPENPEELYIGLREGGLYYSSNGAQSWTLIPEPILDDNGVLALAVDFQEDNNIIYAAGIDTGICKSNDSGANWLQILDEDLISDTNFTPANDKKLIRALRINPRNSDQIFAADWYSGIYISENAGQNWQILNDGLEIRSINNIEISSNGALVYAATRGSGLYLLKI